MKKKASLSLSVNAIVVLILAIVMLGLGLGFVTNMFGDLSGKMKDQINKEPEPPFPGGNDIITLSRESLATNAGDTQVLKVSAFNPSNETWSNSEPLITCSGLGLQTGDVSTNQRDVPQGGYQTFTVLIDIPKKNPDTYLCQVQLKGRSKDFTIEITQ